MSPKTPSNIKSIFGQSDGALASILRKAQQLKILQDRVAACLTPPLREHCWVADVKGDTLILMTDSAAWATRLNYMVNDLLYVLKTEHQLGELRSIKCKVGTPPKL